MKKYILAFSTALSLLVFIAAANASAMDRGGCLTCHRYPGFVKYEEKSGFKVLHIDEEKHLQSPHSKTECRECHPKTVQIPHTNVTEVECTTRCHYDDKDKIDNIDRSYLVNFHKEERFAITRLDDETSCRICHPLYPHSEHNKVRAFLNMHTGFMLCEVCHVKDRHLDNMTYDWKKPETFEFTGEPYGTHQKHEKKKKEKQKSVISKMLKILSNETADAESPETLYLLSRIAVYKTSAGKKSLMVNTQDNEKAKHFLEKEGSLTPDKKKQELDYYHRDIAKKEISVACDECHSKEGIMDFRALGFSDNRVKDLRYLNLKGLVTKYETFYIPNLFGPKR